MKFLGTLPAGLLLIFSTWITPIQAQITVSGSVKDAQTDEVLPSATVLIKGTYSGTISNPQGKYSIKIDSLPATLQVRYIGYHSEEIRITTRSDTTINFALEPSTEQLEEIVVTNEDPAVRIMREVIKHKQQWRPEIKTYRAEAYTRAILENDTSIVSITETVSDIFWDHQDGHREVIKQRRQTNNIAQDENFTGVNYVPNFYDDDIEIAEFKLVGPTHPDALKFYTFTLEDRSQIDGQTVFEIKVTPKKELQPTFRGTIFVLDEEYVLLEVRLKPSEVVKFPPPVRDFNLSYEQQFRSFEQNYWLPVDMRVKGLIKIKFPGIEFPAINFTQLSRITDYQVNAQLPDSLYDNDNVFMVDSVAVRNDSLFDKTANVVPLSEDEAKAYRAIDSTQTLEEAFKPSGVLAGLADNDEDEGGIGFSNSIPGDLSPTFRFNRVDEFHGGLSYEKRFFDRRLSLASTGGFSTGYDAFNYDWELRVWPHPKTRRFIIGARYYKMTTTRYNSSLFTMPFTSFQPLLGAEDYFDYFLNEGFRIRTGFMFPGQNVTLRMNYRNEDHSSLTKNTEYDLLGRAPFRRINPAINSGDLNSFTWKIELGEGGTNETFDVAGSNGATLAIEHSGDYLNSDFDFTRYTFNATYRIATLFQRRFVPNTLDLNIRGGTFTGDLPLQRFGAVDASLSSFNRFGALKTLKNRPYDGEHYFSFALEHNFRTIPFEILGLDWPVERGWGLIAFGGAGRTWTGDDRMLQLQNNQNVTPLEPDNLHSEIGISLNGIFSLFRVDVAYRVDNPSLFFGFGVARLF